ncbi:MAG TPA: DUF2889 domain-containing protein [Castellaniella sp.]|nr:DUF2889 domain-containing protein [Castellaniella sp.]
MPLSAPACARQPIHTRSIRVDSYLRDDGLWDLEAELVDTKAYDFQIRNGDTHRAGDPVHLMQLRVTIDDDLNIVDAEVSYGAAPYGDLCSAIAPAYKALVGLNLRDQFRKRVLERFARTAGCTHVTELTNVLPTVAIQTMAARRRAAPPTATRPFQLGGCHALALDAPAVRTFYPQWYEPRKSADED